MKYFFAFFLLFCAKVGCQQWQYTNQQQTPAANTNNLHQNQQSYLPQNQPYGSSIPSNNLQQGQQTGMYLATNQYPYKVQLPQQYNNGNNVQTQGRPPIEMNTPQHQMNMPSNQMYAPQNQIYAPLNYINSPPMQINVPPNHMNVPQNTNIPSNQMYTSQNQMYTSPNYINTPPMQMNAPPNNMNIPPNQMYAPQNQMYTPQNQINTPPNQMNSSPNQGGGNNNQNQVRPAINTPPNQVPHNIQPAQQFNYGTANQNGGTPIMNNPPNQAIYNPQPQQMNQNQGRPIMINKPTGPPKNPVEQKKIEQRIATFRMYLDAIFRQNPALKSSWGKKFNYLDILLDDINVALKNDFWDMPNLQLLYGSLIHVVYRAEVELKNQPGYKDFHKQLHRIISDFLSLIERTGLMPMVAAIKKDFVKDIRTDMLELQKVLSNNNIQATDEIAQLKDIIDFIFQEVKKEKKYRNYRPTVLEEKPNEAAAILKKLTFAVEDSLREKNVPEAEVRKRIDVLMKFNTLFLATIYDAIRATYDPYHAYNVIYSALPSSAYIMGI